MKFLLVHPYFDKVTQPIRGLGVAYLAAQLKRSGHEVTVLNCPVSRVAGTATVPREWLESEGIEARLRGVEFDAAGISCTFAHYAPYAVALAQAIKRVRDVPVIVGGTHPTLCPETMLQHPEIDFVILGEGEDSLTRLIDAGLSPDSVDGVAFRRDDQIVVRAKRQYLADLDQLPFPDRSVLLWDSKKPDTRFVSVITSRSCPCSCSFCAIPAAGGKRWRTRSPKNVVDELTTIVRQYGPEWVLFEDDNLNADRRRLISICQGIVEARLPIRWLTPNGVQISALDEEVLAHMRRAGCRHISLPIESGDDHIRNDVMGKKLAREQIIRVCGEARRIGMNVEGFFVIGMPGETRRSIDETLRMVRELQLDSAAISYATPFPGTRLHEICVQRGYIDEVEFGQRLDSSAVLPLDSPSFGTEDFDVETLKQWRAELVKAVMESRPAPGGMQRCS